MASNSRVGGDPWILPVWSAANSAAQAGRFPSTPHEITSIGYHISIKLNIIDHVVLRLKRGAGALYNAAKTHGPQHVCVSEREGYTLEVDNEVKYCLIADINAFLFETNSCVELMERLCAKIFSHAGLPSSKCDVRLALKKALAEQGLDFMWFPLLDKSRNFVAHDGTFYLEIDISDSQNWELLILKNSPVEHDDLGDYFTLSELADIAKGFVKAKIVLQEILIEAFQGVPGA